MSFQLGIDELYALGRRIDYPEVGPDEYVVCEVKGQAIVCYDEDRIDAYKNYCRTPKRWWAIRRTLWTS